ncbi:Acyl-coenzyme A thioesterase PaaI, contains HGG motif [Pedococcus dokdonensis]|uniref:Acyl-coenzyme A thioesterase THEM4 n=1 Tax=Pedococcus dokdonensis TaxID=443156 RepID=A0A1H0QLI2_9MICO|nr:PaaI family thioesterase [Pedococcus dokdonensis]SDP18184.1 Acyl-coenzyme A thioesterase PaaI, contains HGG motif [Pedococcus dokdonensis]
MNREEFLASWNEKFRPQEDGAQLPPHHHHCLGCGPDNPHGHHLTVHRRGEEVHATHIFDERHVGAPGIAHGGAVATVLDDLFGYLLYLTGGPAVTRQLEVLYASPVILGTTYRLAARVLRAEGRKLYVEADMRDVEGSLVASAAALFLSVDVTHFDQGMPR